ncbi:DUF4397 domain-containing protein [Ferruginibacter sp. SUN106]|uniref:DUF4397 domain-containing protein n=1 Tax=Ferruginibacter sp. SUN106 TaxID=2978348 RepID=UPI003D35F364
MKKIIKNILLGSIIIAAGSCTKKIEYNAERIFVTTDNALIKINYLSAYVNNPGVQLSINSQRVSGLITGRTPFPGGGYNTNGSNFPDYLAVAPGTNTLSIAIPKKNTNVDSVVLFTTSITLASNKNYTVHVTDTLTNTKALSIEDNLTLPDGNTCKYRFVNMMPNAPFVDLYYNTTLLATKIPYLGSSAYFSYPVQTVAGTWSIRETGTLPTSTAMATYSSLSTSTNQRVYTAFASGYKGATAANTKPYISFLLNQ